MRPMLLLNVSTDKVIMKVYIGYALMIESPENSIMNIIWDPYILFIQKVSR